DLDPLDAAQARVGVASYRTHAAGDFDVGAERDDVARRDRVGAHGERAAPELAVQVLGAGALDALPRTKAVVDRAPGPEEGRQRAHVVRRRAAVTERRGDPWQALLVENAARTNVVEPRGNEVERLVPRDRNEAGILVAPLLRV